MIFKMVTIIFIFIFMAPFFLFSNSKLIQEGLSRHEISERVEGKRMEGKCYTIYGLLYGMLEE